MKREQLTEREKGDVELRQGGRCAWCGEDLQGDVEYHHVIPLQASDGLGVGDRNYIASSENYVALHKGLYDLDGSLLSDNHGCHYEVHDRGQYAGGTVAEEFPYARVNQHEQRAWEDRQAKVWDRKQEHEMERGMETSSPELDL